ncbi:MAG: hypothetical protein Q9217_000380 [Psora testacea]
MVLIALLWTLIATAYAAPSINLPINAQVPPVARVNQPFKFIFSESTFTSPTGNINYALSKSPAWLALEGSSRTLSGLPNTEDAGSVIVYLLASDDAGAVIMPVTLVVSVDRGPGLGLPLEEQLPGYGAFSAPNNILLSPSEPLALSFSPSTFTNTNSDTVYYALCANNTPLPSWIHFESTKLAFSGMSPQVNPPGDISQSFSIKLAASNVVGFSDATVEFQIVVESHLLAFSNNFQVIRFTPGSPVNISMLQSNLLLDGQQANRSAITQVSAANPSWLALDSHALVLAGLPPENATDQNFTVTVTDAYGDSASIVAILQKSDSSPTALLNPIGAANATIGSDFVYQLKNIVNAPGAQVTIDLGTASAWLKYDRDALVIKGHLPNGLVPQQLLINVTATQDTESQSEILTIAVQNADQAGSSATETAPSSSTSGTREGSQATVAAPRSRERVQRGWIAAAVILPLAACLRMAYLFACCWKRRRRLERRTYIDGSASTSRAYISQPINDEGKQLASEKGEMSGGLLSRRTSSKISLPPKLPWIWQIRSSKTSLGEGSQRPDSWHRFAVNFSNAAQPKSKAPSDFSRIPEEKIEGGAQCATADGPNTTMKVSPLKKHPKRLRESSTVSLHSSGQLYQQVAGGFGHGRRDPGRGHGNLLSSGTAEGRSRGPRPMGPPGFGAVQKSWRSAKESKSTSEWTDTTGESASQGRDYVTRGHHSRQPTIRPIWPSRRLSNQALKSPTARAPPLPIPKSVRLRRSENPFLSGGSIYGRHFSHRSASFNATTLKYPRERISPKRSSSGALRNDPSASEKQGPSHSYSQSSSVLFPSRPSPSKSQYLPEDRSSRFDYGIAPRIIDIFQDFPHSDTRGSVMSIDPQYESAIPSQSQSMYEYNLEEDPFGDNGEVRPSWPPRYPDPLRSHSADGDDALPGSSAAMLASRLASGPLQRLSRMAQPMEEDSISGDDRTARSDEAASVKVKVRSPRGRRLGQQIGLRHGESANRSMRGEIKRSGSGSFL